MFGLFLPTLHIEERSKPFLVSFNHFFFVSDLGFWTGGVSLLGEGGPEPAKHPIQKKLYLFVKNHIH